MKENTPKTIIIMLLILCFCLGYLTCYFIDETGLHTLENVLSNTSSYTRVNKTFMCGNFSQIFVNQMKEKGYYANIITGKGTNYNKNNISHAWVEIWINPETGRLIRLSDNYTEVPIWTKLYNKMLNGELNVLQYE